MSKSKMKKLKLNVKFINGAVACAKSPGLCKDCKDINNCEIIKAFYDPYEGIAECFRNSESKR